MHLIMFDIDGTLIESYDFDSICFSEAVVDVLDSPVDTNWERYEHVSDLGILKQIIDELPGRCFDQYLVEAVKKRFLHHLSQHIENTDIREISGASEFLNYLRSRSDVVVSLATGGWYESAQLKLNAAGIDTAGVPIASSSDHYSRTEIMKISEQSTQKDEFSSKTYFGDGAWDLHASKQLDYGFILVGNRIDWEPCIENYLNMPKVLKHIGL